MDSILYPWLHLLAFASYTGATLSLLVVSIPQARAEPQVKERLRRIAAAMRVYDPLGIGMLGLLVMTGAFRLTDYKAALRATFFEQLGGVLAWKLLFAFVLINFGAYVAFGVGHRLVRAADLDQDVEEAWLDSMLRRLRASAVTALVLAAATAWIAIRLAHGTPRAPGG